MFACTALAARADTVKLTLTPTDGSAVTTATFDSTADLLSITPGTYVFYQSAAYDGTNNYVAVFTFFNPAFLGFDFASQDVSLNQPLYSGVALYNEVNNLPMFLYGTYSLTAESGQPDATLKLEQIQDAVTPEPSSLLLLGTGLAGIGLMLRRRLAA